MNKGTYFQKTSPNFKVDWKSKEACNDGLGVFVPEALQPNDDVATGEKKFFGITDGVLFFEGKGIGKIIMIG